MIVDSKQEVLALPDLLMDAAEEARSEAPVDLVLASFYREIQMPDSQFYKYGNTIFVVHQAADQPGTGTFRALNADTAQNYLQATFQFLKDAYADGLWLLVTEFKDQSILNLFRMIAHNPPNPGMAYEVTQDDQDGEYQVVLTLGTPPEGVDPEQANANAMQQMSLAQQPQQPQSPQQPMGALNQLGGAQ